MSAIPQPNRADRVAGFLCAFSFALSGLAIARSPGVLATAAIAVATGAVAFVLGMVVAVLTDNGIY
jgi:hypothetical protein